MGAREPEVGRGGGGLRAGCILCCPKRGGLGCTLNSLEILFFVLLFYSFNPHPRICSMMSKTETCCVASGTCPDQGQTHHLGPKLQPFGARGQRSNQPSRPARALGGILKTATLGPTPEILRVFERISLPFVQPGLRTTH